MTLSETVDVDSVVLATGFEYRLPPFLEPFAERLDLDEEGNLCFHEDFSIRWDGPAEDEIFGQNAARHFRGIADPNLSLMAGRSARSAPEAEPTSVAPARLELDPAEETRS